jgi:hypothetical protein
MTAIVVCTKHRTGHRSVATRNRATTFTTFTTFTINIPTMASDELQAVLSPLLAREERAIWITPNSYVRFGGDRAVEDLHEQQFTLDLSDTGEYEHFLSIHASTQEESIICLDYLVGLNDTHFEEMVLTYKGDGNRHLFPSGANILEKILQNLARRICFNFMIFTSDHCRTLVSSGTKTDIEFYSCEFQDGGTAFVEASAARHDETSGPAKLGISGTNPFNDRNWSLLLSQHKLESLKLSNIHLSSEAVATAKVGCLTLSHGCRFGDDGASLLESVKEGRSPQDLCFRDNPFDSSERFVTFINALRGNTNLERLELPLIGDHEATQALASALHENEGLVHLTVNVTVLDDIGRTELLKTISLHPSLRSLDLRCSTRYAMERRDFTKAVADMFSINTRVEVVRFYYDTFDKDDWDMNVAPRLECNVYRKRFSSVLKIEETSTRAAVLARVLAKFASKSHLLWMLLNQNHDIVSSYLDSANDPQSPPFLGRNECSLNHTEHGIKSV